LNDVTSHWIDKTNCRCRQYLTCKLNNAHIKLLTELKKH